MWTSKRNGPRIVTSSNCDTTEKHAKDPSLLHSFMVKRMSFAVNGTPSCHLTSLRSPKRNGCAVPAAAGDPSRAAVGASKLLYVLAAQLVSCAALDRVADQRLS